MKPPSWSAPCLLAGALCGLAFLPASAQPVLPPTSAGPIESRSLTAAFEAAWSRAVQQRQAAGATRQAQASRTAADSLWPSSPALEWSHRDGRKASADGSRESEVGIAWPLWMPGQRGARSASADADLAHASASEASARLVLAGKVREAYWAVHAQVLEVRVARQQAEVAQRLVKDVQRRVQAGDLAPADGLAARAEEMSAEKAIAEAMTREASARRAWTTLTGLQSLPEGSATAPAVAAAQATTSSIDEHPDVRLAIQALAQAQARAEVVRSQRADPPELYLRARQERAQRGANVNTLGVGMRIPLGTSARNAPLEAAALTEVEVAEATLQRMQVDKAAEREDARAAFQAAQAQLPRDRERASLLRQRSTWVEQAFGAGNTSLPELLRAIDMASQAELLAARQQHAVGAAYARLQQAFGLLP